MEKKTGVINQMLFTGDLDDKKSYLLQQRVLQQLNTFVRVLAQIPRD